MQGAFDIEAANWSHWKCGALVGIDGYRFLTWDEDAYFDALMRRRGEWYAWAGGGYDVLWVIEQCARRGIRFQAIPRGSALLNVAIDGGPTLVDACALWPDRLEVASRVLGADMGKIGLGLACECEARSSDNPEGCGGYCALARPLSPAERRSVEGYLWRDTEACLGVVQAIRGRAEEDGIVLRSTIGSSAWATASEWLGIPKASHCLSRYWEIREAYFGGRVECYQTDALELEGWDLHSAYPAALSKIGLPVGGPRFLTREAAGRALSADRPGVYTVTIEIPESDIPPLPMRTDKRLYYPWGRMEGTWALPEIARAMAVGARVTKVHRAYVWPRLERVLAPYADRVWALRERALKATSKTDSTWAKWYKWLANSLTGKTAQRPEYGTYAFDPHPVSVERVEEIQRAGRIRYITRHGVHSESVVERLGPSAYPEWASYLTAATRVEGHCQLVHAGDGRVYFDTDGLKSTRVVSRRIGDALGEWGHEGRMRNWRCAAPKVYRYESWNEEKARWEWNVRGKGLPGLTAEGLSQLLEGKAWVADRGVDRYRTVRKGGDLFRRRSIVRKLRGEPGWFGGRMWDGGSRTRAPNVSDIPAGA